MASDKPQVDFPFFVCFPGRETIRGKGGEGGSEGGRGGDRGNRVSE